MRHPEPRRPHAQTPSPTTAELSRTYIKAAPPAPGCGPGGPTRRGARPASRYPPRSSIQSPPASPNIPYPPRASRLGRSRSTRISRVRGAYASSPRATEHAQNSSPCASLPIYLPPNRSHIAHSHYCQTNCLIYTASKFSNNIKILIHVSRRGRCSNFPMSNRIA